MGENESVRKLADLKSFLESKARSLESDLNKTREIISLVDTLLADRSFKRVEPTMKVDEATVKEVSKSPLTTVDGVKLADFIVEEQTIKVSPKANTEGTWEWLIKDTDWRTLPLTNALTQCLVDHQSRQPEGYPYVFVPPVRYNYIQHELRAKGKWTYSDSRLKVVNNFCPDFRRILQRAGVEIGTFHDLRRTAICNWFKEGMREYDVMKLAGHADFRQLTSITFASMMIWSRVWQKLARLLVKVAKGQSGRSPTLSTRGPASVNLCSRITSCSLPGSSVIFFDVTTCPLAYSWTSSVPRSPPTFLTVTVTVVSSPTAAGDTTSICSPYPKTAGVGLTVTCCVNGPTLIR